MSGGKAGRPGGDPPPPPEAEIRDLAERFLDLWQRQATALMDEPAIARGMAQWLAQAPMMMGMPAAGRDGGGPAGTTEEGEDEQPAEAGSRAPGGGGARDGAAGGGGGPAAMAGAPAAASGFEQFDPGELMRRLAACEERLAQLESGLPRRRR